MDVSAKERIERYIEDVIAFLERFPAERRHEELMKLRPQIERDLSLTGRGGDGQFVMDTIRARLTAASRAWLPGDLLYPLKPMAEQAALLASLTKEGDAQLHIQFAHRRLIEAQSLVFENRYEQIPAAVADFDRHVSQAVILVNQMAGVQQDEARSLATELQQALTGQMGMIILLTNLTPDTSQAEFHRLLIISEDGVLGVQNVLPPDDGDAQHQSWRLFPRITLLKLGEG